MFKTKYDPNKSARTLVEEEKWKKSAEEVNTYVLKKKAEGDSLAALANAGMRVGADSTSVIVKKPKNRKDKNTAPLGFADIKYFTDANMTSYLEHASSGITFKGQGDLANIFSYAVDASPIDPQVVLPSLGIWDNQKKMMLTSTKAIRKAVESKLGKGRYANKIVHHPLIKLAKYYGKLFSIVKLLARWKVDPGLQDVWWRKLSDQTKSKLKILKAIKKQKVGPTDEQNYYSKVKTGAEKNYNSNKQKLDEAFKLNKAIAPIVTGV